MSKLHFNLISVERWFDQHGKPTSTFTRVGSRRVDGWFARYVDGREPPRYPVPALAEQHIRAHPVVLWMTDNWAST